MPTVIRFLTEGAGAILGFFVALVPLIALHELGHMFTAKAVGVWVREFGIGFPPRIKKLFQWQETEFTLNWLPLGGFARMEGEVTFAEEDPAAVEEKSPEQLADAAEAHRHSLYAQPPGRRMLIFLGGPLMNLLTAWVLAVVMFIPGYPVADTSQVRITQVVPGSPAARAGIQAGDVLIAIDGQPATDTTLVIEVTRANAGVEMPLTVRRDGAELELRITPRVDPPPREGAMGIGLGDEALVVHLEPHSLPKAVAAGTRTFSGIMTLVLRTPVDIIRGLLPLKVARPVGIVNISRIGFQSIQQSVATGTLFPLFNLLIMVSISLGIFNLLPIPALDGGRILFTVVEIARRRPLTPALEERIHQVSLLLLLAVFVAITVMDFMFPVNLLTP